MGSVVSSRNTKHHGVCPMPNCNSEVVETFVRVPPESYLDSVGPGSEEKWKDLSQGIRCAGCGQRFILLRTSKDSDGKLFPAGWTKRQ